MIVRSIRPVLERRISIIEQTTIPNSPRGTIRCYGNNNNNNYKQWKSNGGKISFNKNEYQSNLATIRSEIGSSFIVISATGVVFVLFCYPTNNTETIGSNNKQQTSFSIQRTVDGMPNDSSMSLSLSLPVVGRFIERSVQSVSTLIQYTSMVPTATQCEATTASSNQSTDNAVIDVPIDDITNDINDDDDDDDDEFVDASGYTESERFYQALEYYRALLPEYERQWREKDNKLQQQHQQNGNSTNSNNNSVLSWPRNIPTSLQLPALVLDYEFCKQQNNNNCYDQQFRIASYYVSEDNGDATKLIGYKMIKELAEKGHPDGMCLLGILLNEGKIPGIDINPQVAVVWWRRCVDTYRHIYAMYELANAYYLGEGVAENPTLAVRYFRRAANLGHAGSAYMLGQCLLDGVGVPHRDRATALEWIITAAELGHHLARKRVAIILHEEYSNLNVGIASTASERHEAMKWMNSRDQKRRAVNIERRHTIGGGSTNRAVLATRLSKVAESRDTTKS